MQSSIVDKRVFLQLQELKRYPKALLIIESSSENTKPMLSENALRGFILSTLLNYQVPILFTSGAEETADYLTVLAKKREKSEFSLRPKVPMSESEQKQFILEGFPNVGPVKAKKLIEKFKNLKNIFNASESELRDILGKNVEAFKGLLD